MPPPDTAPKPAWIAVIIVGAVNWAMYRAMDSAGITVVAALAPAFAEAVDMK